MINTIPPTTEKMPSIETNTAEDKTGLNNNIRPNIIANAPPSIITHLPDAASNLNPAAIDDIPVN